LGTNPVELGDQGGHDVCGLPDGGFVVVFEDRNLEQVFGVQCDDQGDPLPVPGAIPDAFVFRMDPDASPAARAVWAPSVSAFPDGSYVVAYNSESVSASPNREIRARKFEGPDIGGLEFEAGHHPFRWQDPDVLALPDRSLIFAWQGRNEPAAGPAWSARVYPRNVTGPHAVPAFVAGADELVSRDQQPQTPPPLPAVMRPVQTLLSRWLTIPKT
jgi:hypothetical protein